MSLDLGWHHWSAYHDIKLSHSNTTEVALRSPPPLLELRYSGVLLGLMIGDSLASPMDGWTATETEIMHPTGVRSLGPRNVLDQLGVDFPPGHVTDRTSLALALATSLL